MSIILPKKKQAILKYIKKYIADHDFAPTLSEIARRFKLSSPATVHEHMSYLEKHGFIRKQHGTIEVLNTAATNPLQSEETYVPGSAIQLPIVGLITAGEPIEALEDRSEVLSVPREMVSKKDAYILKVKGDSMIESFIDDGDFVVVQKQEHAENGDIVVALLNDGSATLKEYHKERTHIRHLYHAIQTIPPSV